MAVQNVANIVMGPATLYVGALGVITAMPADTTVNSVPASGAWRDAGGTDGGVTFDITPKFSPLVADQIVDTIDERLTSRAIMVTTTLAETTLANLALALNSTAGASGAGFASLEPDYGPYASQTQKISLLVDGWAPAVVPNARRRLYLPRCQQTGKIAPVYDKTKQVGFSVQFVAYYVSTTQAPYHIVDQTS